MKKVLDFIERISKEFAYKPLPSDKSVLAREWYKKHLPTLNPNQPIYTRTGTMLARSFKRIVIGDYGAYIEFSGSDLTAALQVKKGQEYRCRDSFNGKYIWYTLNDDIKVYYQLRGVAYANYKPGMYYISPYEVIQYDNDLLRCQDNHNDYCQQCERGCHI